MGMAMMNSRNAALDPAKPGADRSCRSRRWFPMYNAIPGSITANQEWEMAFLFGGMLFAVLRGNTDARDFVAARMVLRIILETGRPSIRVTAPTVTSILVLH